MHTLIKKIVLTPLVLLTATSAIAASCPPEDMREFTQRRTDAVMLVSKQVALGQYKHGVIADGIYEITVSELYMITNGCLAESDSRLLSRNAALTNQVSGAPAAFYIFAVKTKKDVAIDLFDLTGLFDTTLQLTHKE